MKYIIANWKANKNYTDAKVWIEAFIKQDLEKLSSHMRIIICPPHPFLSLVKESFVTFPHIQIGAQDISFYATGAYTGEVTAYNLIELADYVIIGHSKRREYFKETYPILEQKTLNAKDAKIEPIFCIRNETDLIPHGVKLVAYDPTESIGTGNSKTMEEILDVKKKSHLASDGLFVYGGSVNSSNAADYLNNPELDGLLMGGASLDPVEFYKIAQQAIS